MNPGFQSIYGRAQLCPDPDIDPDAWLRFMVELGRKVGDWPALIPSSDLIALAIAAHATVLKDRRTGCLRASLSRGCSPTSRTQDPSRRAAWHADARGRSSSGRWEVTDFVRETTFPCLMSHPLSRVEATPRRPSALRHEGGDCAGCGHAD